LLDTNLLDEPSAAAGDGRGDGVDGGVLEKESGNCLLPTISSVRDWEGIYDLLDGLELHGGHDFLFIRILYPNRRAIMPKSVDTRTISFFRVDPSHNGL